MITPKGSLIIAITQTNVVTDTFRHVKQNNVLPENPPLNWPDAWYHCAICGWLAMGTLWIFWQC